MTRIHTILRAACAAGITLGLVGVAAAQDAPAGSQTAPGAQDPVAEESAPLAELPQTPAAIEELILARPFTLQQAYRTDYRKDRPLVEAGWLLVVRADPALLAARQVAMPVVQVGNQIAERTNFGGASGVAVLIVPSERKADGRLALDLAKSPIFFADPILPEKIGAEEIADGLAAAEAFALDVRPAAELAEAARRGGGEIALADREALLAAAARLVMRWSPDEAALVEPWLAR